MLNKSEQQQVPLLKISNAKKLVKLLATIETDIYELLNEAGFPEEFYKADLGYMSDEPMHRLLALLAKRHHPLLLTKLYAKFYRESLIRNIHQKLPEVETIGEAISQLLQLVKTESPATRLELQDFYGQPRLCRYSPKQDGFESVWGEIFAIVAFVELIRSFGLQQWQPTQLYFHNTDLQRTECIYSSEQTQIFTGYDCTAILLSSDLLQTAFKANVTPATEKTEAAVQSTFIDAVYTATEQYVGDPKLSIEWIAELLNYSPRTLQRRLKEHGVAFKEVREAIVIEKAIELLDQNQLSVVEISIELGYANPPQFSRAFKRLTGFPPSHYHSK